MSDPIGSAPEQRARPGLELPATGVLDLRQGEFDGDFPGRLNIWWVPARFLRMCSSQEKGATSAGRLR